MIFNTFENNDIDKWTAKIGLFGKSFNELGMAINSAFKTYIDNIDNFDKDISFGDALKQNLFSKDDNWIKNSLGEIVSKDNIDSYIKELDLDSAKEKAKSIFDFSEDVKNGEASWDEYFNTCKGGNEYIIDVVKSTDDLSKLTGEDLVVANQKARASAIAHNNALKQQTLGAKAANVALKGLAMAGNMLVSLGISAIISLTIKGLDNLVHAADNAKESAESFSNSFKSMNEEFTSNDSKLSDLQKQYDKLSKGVNSLGENVSLTTDEYDTYKQVISEISDMIPNLLARYDDEGNKIGFVQGKLKDLSAEYDNYKRKKAMDLVNGENDNGDSIKDVFKNYGYQIYHSNPDNQYGDGTTVGIPKAFGSSNYEKIEQLKVQIKYGDGNTPGFNKLTNEQIEEKTALIQKYQSEIDASVSSIQDAMVAIGQSGNEYYKLSDKQQQFFDTYIGSLSQDVIDKNGLYNETAARTFVNNFIKDIKADKNKVLEAYNDLLSFDVNDSSLNPEQIKEQVDKLLQALAKALGDEDWQDLKIRLGFEFVDDNASDYEKFVDRTKNKLSKFGGEGTGKLMNFFSANGIDSSKGVNEFLDVYNTTEQAKKGIYDADVAMQEWIKHSKEASDTSTPTTLSSAWEQLKASTDDATKGVADDLQTLADKGELTIDTFKDTDGAENYFDGLGISAENAVKYINSLSDKNSQLGAMSKNIKSITDALGTKASDGLVSVDDLSGFDATIKGLSTWEKFSTLLGDASSSMEDCQKIANELATEYVNSESVLSNLNETNRAYYESQLDNMGVTNSAAVVEAALAKNLGEEKIATEEAVKAGLSLHGTKIDTTNATELFSNATAGEIIQLANEANQSGVSSQALALLAVKKLNNPALTTDGDIKNLMDLCKGLDLATQAIKTFQSIKNSVMNPNGTFKATGTAGAQQSEALNNAFNAMKSLVKTSVGGASVNSHGSSGGGTSGGGGGGSSSTAKTAFDKLSDWASQFFDWIEVRLDRLQKKIDSNISKAESKLNDKRYSSATANYMSAVGNTYTKMYTEQKGRDKYLNMANSYLNKAISLGAINKKLAKEIKTRVADGSINISRYSSDIQTVISTYKDWIDKAKDCTTAMQTLHDSLRTYAEDLKKVSDAQRDATVSIAETKQTIATGGVQNTATAKNSSLGYNNSVLNTKNSAYYTAAKSANSNVNRFAKSATSALNKGKIKKNTKYNATLNSIKGYIKKRVAIPDSLLTIVAKKNATLYNRLYMYNLSIENLQTAREEYTTAFAVNNAEKYNNIADKYKNWDDATNDTMDMNSTKSSNAVSAKDKNSYLDKQKSGYGTIVTRDKNEQNEYNKARATAKSNMFKSAKGASYSSLSKTNRNTINKYINDARKSAKSGKIISVSTLAKLSEYYKKGYISSGFFNSCIDYNNALESYNQAKAQTEIDEQTQITQRAEIASQKFSNISTEYDNKRHQYDQTATELNNNMSILEERGNGASATWYSRLAKNEESSKDNLIQKRASLIKELNDSVKNGDVAYKSEKWYEMRSQIDDVTNSIDEATKSFAEYNNQIMQVHWDRIDEQANKVQNLIDENNFIIDELSRRDLTSDDTGGLTSEGNAVAGLHISNYEAYKKNAETYYAEIESINKKLANDPYNQKLIDQKEKLVKSYQDCVKGAEDEKWATIDLMKSGYDALKNHISDLIDKFNDLLDSEKDAYDYANNISEKTKTLSDLRKQLVAISGDTSEETRAKAQELNQSLKDAEKDLKDTQYDKLISSTKDMLSDFQTDLDDSIQDVIKNLDDNFSQLINNIDSHWNNETITSLMEKIQYVATDSFNNVSADGKISESTGNVVSDIQSFMEKAWAKYDLDAKTTQQDKINEATKEEVKNNILNKSNSGSSSGASTDVKIDANKLISRIDNPTNKISPAYNTTTNTNSTAPVGKVLSTSQKKWVNDFLKKNIVVARQDVSKYGNLNKVLYRNWGKKILPTSKWTELAKKIGFSNFSSATNSAFYQTLHRSGIKGFKKGSDGIPYDMIANLGENGTELQYDVSKGILKSVGQGDMIFTAEQAKTLMEFAKNPMAYKNMYTGTAFSMPSVPVNNKVDNDVNISIGDVKLEGVQDPKQFATAMKDVIKNNTGGVRSMIKEDTIGSLSKGYNSQSVKRW